MINKLDPGLQSKNIQDTIKATIEKQFPVVGNYQTLELVGPLKIQDDLDDQDFPAQKAAKLSGKSWQVPLYGTFRLIDQKSGRILDTVKDIKVANIPKLTDRFSMLIDGNEYTTMNQFRLKPGIYTRKKANDEMESQFNLAVGYNFKMQMNPAEGIFYLFIGNQKFHLYTLLHSFGMGDPEMLKTWGRELFNKNQAEGMNEEGVEIPLMYEKLKRQKLPYDKALAALKDYFDKTRIAVESAQVTIGISTDRVSPETLLATSSKLLKVLKGQENEDERDSLVFKDLYTVDDLLNAYLEKRAPTIQKNIQTRADHKQLIREIISPDTYTKDIKSFFTQGDLSNPSPQTNPVEMIGEWRKTTITGTGGIKSEHAITFKTRDIHPSHLGFLDPLNTPESGKVGVTLPLAMNVQKVGKDILTPLMSAKGDLKYVTPGQFYQMKIGFPDQHSGGKAKNKLVKAMWKGQSTVLPAGDIEGYVVHPTSMFAWTTNLVPFLGNNSGNRALVAAKMVTQSVPLKNPETPLVKVTDDRNEPLDIRLGNFLRPVVPKGFGAAEVIKIDDDYITIKNDKKETHKVGLYKDFPLNQESFINNRPIVKIGDKLKEGDPLADTNFADATGQFAPGANVNVAYMPWHGYNYEDGIIVTDSLAKKFTSIVMLKHNLQTDKDGILDAKKFVSYYPKAMTLDNIKKLDAQGIIKEGQIIQPGETMIAYLQPADLTDTEKLLKNLNRTISNPYRNKSLTWVGEHPGVVSYVRKIGNTYQIHVKEEQPLRIGDKLAARYGDKGIVTKIIPDSEAPYTKDGTRIDMMLNIHGVVGRMNMGQLLETAAGRIAQATGKPYLVQNFSDKNYLDDIIGQMKALKLQPNEILLDGQNGKPFEKPIFWGNKHYLKLMHVVEHKYKARSTGTYDANEQPIHGDTGGQSVDPLQIYSFLGHGARENLYEFAAVKGQQNDEYWRAIQLGLPPPPPQRNFVWDKMMAYIKAAGVNVEKNGHKVQLFPATSEDALNWSAGELTDPGHMLRGKDLATIPGGLFDTKLTGGKRGTNWTHFTLEEPIPNPMFESAIKSILGINTTQFERIINEEDKDSKLKGNQRIAKMLADVDVDRDLIKAKKDLKIAGSTQVNGINRRIRFLQVLQAKKLAPEKAYMMEILPVLPPIFRPSYPLPSGDTQTSPINYHYRDVALINKAIKEIKGNALLDDMEMNKKNRAELYHTVKALQGLTESHVWTTRQYEGLLDTLAGSSPKHGFIQNKAWSKRQDLSARSTITVEPSLGIDQVGLPDVMLKETFKPFIMREIVRQGYKPTEAIQNMKDWTPVAEQALNNVIRTRPVLLNRAPSLHKHSVQAFWPVRFEGASIRVNPLVAKGFNFDFDGDTMSMHVPVSEKAVEEAKGMLPTKNLYKAGDRSHMINIEQDYQLGLYYLSLVSAESGKSFSSIEQAERAIKQKTTSFTFNGQKMTLGQYEINKPLPQAMKDYEREMTSKNVKALMDKLFKEYPGYFGTVVDAWKEIGRAYAVERGSTVSITDMVVDRSYRDDILKKYEAKIKPGMNKYEVAAIYGEAKEEITKAQDERLKGKNNFYDMLQAGSTSKKENITQVVSLPGVFRDVNNVPIPYPVKKSWSEGLDTFDYWNQSYGARKGVVDRSVNTQDSGALNKELLFTTRSLLVTEEDCNTPEGILLPTDSKEVMDRFLVQDLPGVGKRNDLVTAEVVAKAKRKKLEKLPVRSALTCETEGGVCQKCYGLMVNGQLARIGENVGVIDSEALTERSTQLTMQTFHTGGAGKAGSVTLGFPRLQELLHVPEKIVDAAVLSRQEGIVTNINENPAGGKNLFIGTDEYYIPRERELVVAIGSKVKRGDQLTKGSIRPQELSELKDHLTAQQYVADEINNIYDNKFARKTFETVLRGVSNNAEVLNVPEESEHKVDFMRGDTVHLTRLKRLNRELAQEGKPLIEYRPYFKSIDVLPLKSNDWLGKLTTNRLVQTIQDAASMGQEGNIKGTDPMGAYLFGLEFGKDIKPKKGEFY